MLRTYIYICKNCKHEWIDARPKEHADMPVKIGCRKCKSKDITFHEKLPEKFQKASAPVIGDSVRMGRGKLDEGFKDVLRNIKHRNKGSTINID